MDIQSDGRDDLAYRRELVDKYRPFVEKLTTYTSWLESKKGNAVSSTYTGDGIAEHSISFPVYDSTLLALIKLLQSTPLIDRNYVYVYSRNRIKTKEDELNLIHRSELKDTANIGAVMSRYVLEGMRRGSMWTEGVTSGIFLEAINQLKKNIEYWDVPIR
ncbi:MAG: hypothetical protein IJ058_07530 [Lachnospiraceae bacterium]|nr:hypothetical protein [Lachnospiraceae bacterium]